MDYTKLSGTSRAYKNGKYYILDIGKKLTKKECYTIVHERDLTLSIPASRNGRTVFFSENPYSIADLNGEGSILGQLGDLHRHSRLLSPRSKIDFEAIVPKGEVLFDYQKVAVEYLVEKGSGLVGEPVGLGKTCIAIAYANYLRSKKTIVVVPSGLKTQWANNIVRWSLINKPIIHIVKDAQSGVNPFADYVILSYDMCRNFNILRALGRTKWDLLICDECHKMKNIEANMTKAILGDEKGHYRIRGNEAQPLINSCTYKAFLSGTPIKNRPLEIYSVARALNWEAIDYMPYSAFKSSYSIPKVWDSVEIVARELELQNRLRCHLMVRHDKAEVQPQIKKPRFQIIEIDDDSDSIKAALHAESLIDLSLTEIMHGSKNIEIQGMITTARRLMGVALAPFIADQAEDFLQNDEKLMIFAWHSEVVQTLKTRLAKYNPVTIVGSMNQAARDRAKNSFITDSSCRVIILNIIAGGVGLDGMQIVCSNVWIAESSWTMVDNEQAIARADRLGQSNVVDVSFFVAPDSITERVLITALKKVQIVHKTLDKLS